MVNALSALEQIQTLPQATLETMIQRGELDAELELLFGPELARELREIAATPKTAVLGAARPRVVLIPGITGSTLHGADGALIWLQPLAIREGRLRDLALGEDEAARGPIRAGKLLDLIYLPMQLHLKHLARCEVIPFAYDWRLSPADLAERLRDALLELGAQGEPVHLVCHSMGGLVARWLCARYPEVAAAHVAQVIMLGTPNFGSCEPVRHLTVGGPPFTLPLLRSPAVSAVQVARTLPSLYAMLPAPREAYPRDAPLPYPFESSDFDYYRPEDYRADGLRPRHLAAARASGERLGGALPVPAVVIAGHGRPTCVGVRRSSREEAPFDFATYVSELGDGTVPLGSAASLPGARRYYVPGGEHGALPSYRRVRDAVQALIRGREPALATSHRPGGVLGPGQGSVAGSVPEPVLPSSLDAATLAQIDARLEAGTATASDLRTLAQLL